MVGERIVTWLWGGYCGRQSDAEPLLLAALPAAVRDRRRGRPARLGAARRRPEQPDRRRAEGRDKDTVPFTPYATIKDALRRWSCFMLFFAWFVFYMPNYLGHADNYIPANPAGDAGAYRAGMVLPAVLRDPARDPGQAGRRARDVRLDRWSWRSCPGSTRPRCARRGTVRCSSSSSGSSSLVCIGLGYLGAKPAEGGYVIASRMLTLYYFPLSWSSCRCSAGSRRRNRCLRRSPTRFWRRMAGMQPWRRRPRETMRRAVGDKKMIRFKTTSLIAALAFGALAFSAPRAGSRGWRYP